MIPAGTRVIFSPPNAPGLHGVVIGQAAHAFAPAWPGATVYIVRIGADGYFVIGDLLTVIEGPAAAYNADAGRA